MIVLKYRLQPVRNNIVPDGKLAYYPVLVKNRTVTIDELAKFIQERCSFTKADVVGMLEAFSDAVGCFLEMGGNVNLKGLGTLSLKVALKDKQIESDKITGKEIEVRHVNFRISPELLKRLKEIDFKKDLYFDGKKRNDER